MTGMPIAPQDKEERQRKKAKLAAKAKLSFMGDDEEDEGGAAEPEEPSQNGAAEAAELAPVPPQHKRFAKLGVCILSTNQAASILACACITCITAKTRSHCMPSCWGTREHNIQQLSTHEARCVVSLSCTLCEGQNRR